MAATDTQLLNAARDSLLRILETDTSSWSEEGKAQHQFDIDKQWALIEKLEKRVSSAGGRRLHLPMRRVNA